MLHHVKTSNLPYFNNAPMKTQQSIPLNLRVSASDAFSQLQFYPYSAYDSEEPEHQNSKTFIYGTRGMIEFYQLLWIQLKEKDMQQMNFYFTIKDQILDYLEFKIKTNQEIAMEINKNKGIE